MGSPAALLRHCGHLGNMLTSRSNGPSSSPSQEPCVVFLGKTRERKERKREEKRVRKIQCVLDLRSGALISNT